MGGEDRRDQADEQPVSAPAAPAEMSREEWIAYLAGRETPAYSGWADNLPAVWLESGPANRPDAKERTLYHEDTKETKGTKRAERTN